MRIKKYVLLIGLFVLLIIFSFHTGMSFAGNMKKTKNLQLPSMVYIPAGWFWMGCRPNNKNQCWEAEEPYHKVYLNAYYIDRNDVTVSQYKNCVDKKGCTEPTAWFGKPIPKYECNWVVRNRDNHPINCVDWNQANAYCKWLGKSLPTEAQWEKAARGADGRIYPWGNEWDASKACFNKSSTCPVGSYPQGVSPYGVMDMAGNVWDWCSDWYDVNYYKISPDHNPQEPKIEEATLWNHSFQHVMRGGSWVYNNPDYLLSFLRHSSPPTYTSMFVGFRCVREDIAQTKDIQQGRGQHK